MAPQPVESDRLLLGDATYRDNTKWLAWDWIVTVILAAAGFITGYFIPVAEALQYVPRVITAVGVSCSVPMIALFLTRRLSAFFFAGMGSILVGTVYLIAMWWSATTDQYSTFMSHVSGMLFFVLGRTSFVALIVMLFSYILIYFIDHMLDGAHAYAFVFSCLAVSAAYLSWEVVLWLCDRFWLNGYYGMTITVIPALWAGAASCLLYLTALAVGTPVCKRLPRTDVVFGDRVDSLLDNHVASWLDKPWVGIPFLLAGLSLIGLACWMGYVLLGDPWWGVPASLVSMWWDVPLMLIDLFRNPDGLSSTVLNAAVGPCLTLGGIVSGIGLLLLYSNHGREQTDQPESVD